jgi:hypothetical protein
MSSLNTALTLQLANELFQTKYAPYIPDQVYSFGGTTNKLFKPSEEVVGGNGYTQQVVTTRSDLARTSNTVLSDFPQNGLPFQDQSYRVRFNERDGTANDFLKFSAQAKVTIVELLNGGNQMALNIAERLMREVAGSYSTKLAMLRHLPRTAVAATFSGTAKRNNNDALWASATAYTAGSSSFRIQLTTGQVGYFQPGTVWDVTNTAGTVLLTNYYVTDINMGEATPSIGFAKSDFGTATNNADLVTGTGLQLVPVGSLNAGIHSLGSWFSTPTAGETTWIGGIDRTTAANRYLLPTRLRVGATARQVAKSDIGDLGNALGYVSEDPYTVGTVLTDLKVHQTLRDAIGEDAFIQYPTSGDNAERYAHWGSIGLIYQHPQFGLVRFAGDPFAPPDKLRFLVEDDWMCKYALQRGVIPMPGGDMGPWKRSPSDTPGSGYGMAYTYDTFSLMCDVCKNPRRNGEVQAITA